jgi:5-hydroxyisourate hydrolase
MAGITTHVLDTVSGKPGAGMRIEFAKRVGEAFVRQKTVYTNADGRTDQMILAPAETQVGEYELRFFVDEYFRAKGVALPNPAFIEAVPIRFSVFDTAQHYHVPMLCSPWNCTTYRGS